MQNTTNYNLKKPDYTDFADIADINDNMDTIDAQLAAPTGDSADSTTTFTTSDTADGGASSWTNVPALTSGETHKSLFAKMSQMFKNIRFLYKMLGTTDISSIGNGTVTNALSVLNANKQGKIKRVILSLTTSPYGTCRLPNDLTPDTCIVLAATVISSAGHYTRFTATGTSSPYWINVRDSEGNAVANTNITAYVCYIKDFEAL